jgi:signal transduction histidine kinase
MTFQRRLGLAFALMVIPLLLVAALAYQGNRLEREALETLGKGLGRSRTYAEVESALQAHGEIVWRALSGFEEDVPRELATNRQVVTYWLERWEADLRPEERRYAEQVRRLRAQIDSVTDSVLVLATAGRRDEGYRLAQRELKTRLFPELTTLNHEIYRQARVATVQRAFVRVEEIVDREGRLLFIIMAAALATGLFLAAAFARSLVRPITDLRSAMAVVGAGDLDHPIRTEARDEIGDLARSFGEMTARLRESSAARESLNAELAAKIAQLERTQAQLVESEKLASVGQMAAAVAHGLRNPLASLRASAQLALRHPDSPAARESLQSVIEEVDRLDKRVSHLLTFSRPAPTHQMPERLGALVDGAIAPLRTLLADRAISLEIAIPDDLPDVHVDPMKVETAILEIVSNALDAMSGGGQLRLDGAATPDGRVSLDIRDTGRGIPADVLPNVCEPFFTTRSEGTGLGLAIARRFVEQNGGRLEIASVPGEGTTVRLVFPAAPAHAPAGVA